MTEMKELTLNKQERAIARAAFELRMKQIERSITVESNETIKDLRKTELNDVKALDIKLQNLELNLGEPKK